MGNMGSIFFDLGNYFISEKAFSVTSWIDKTESSQGEKCLKTLVDTEL